MPPKSHLPPSYDPYAAVRCTRCKHLRYAGQRVGDPCRFCPCTEHAVPADCTKAGGGER